jgi:cysteinyl-tRNA synthetase
MDLRIYNSLSKNEEVFKPHLPDTVGVYTCGPTVYDYVTIGNWRTYTLGDLLIRALRLNGYKPTYVMNITDVGHLTGDNLGDADTGEDRLEKASRREGKTAWEIAAFYTDDFLQGYKKLNLTQPKLFAKATDHITEQISLVEQLIARGFAYQISDGIYFDTLSYENAGFTYGELSNLQMIKEGVRVLINHEKKNPRDFALWKFSTAKEGGEKRHMEWPSPWGVGFPGWHIECSAMSMKYLGAQFAIHVGGEDLKSTHHPNEIAQSQGATGLVPFVAYWMHGAFLQVDGGKMGKSLGNAYSLHDIESHGFSPLALRYFY